MKKTIHAFCCCIILLLTNNTAYSQFPNISFEMKTSLNAPIDLVNSGDNTGRLFIAEQRGYIRIYRNAGGLDPDTFLNIRNLVLYGGERGLLSIVFHPSYETNRYFFVYYNNLAGDVTIARYRTSASNPDSAEISSGQVLLNIPKPFGNHNGGKLNFGPDGYLYFATGDGGSGGDPFNNAQDPNSLLGKMLRIDVNSFATSSPFYDIPPGNPFVDSVGYRDEIWARGLRNPFRWSFDRLTNDMWIADVGQDIWEEINFRQADTTDGVNYGWRCYEANDPYNTSGCLPSSNYSFPIFQYPQDNTVGGYAVTGGYVYRGTEFPMLQGYYFCADYITGNGWMIKQNGGNFDTALKKDWAPHLCAFGEGEDGTLYAVSLDGPIYKINYVVPTPLRLISFSGNMTQNTTRLIWQTENEINTREFDIEYNNDGQRFIKLSTIAANNLPGTNNYSFNHIPAAAVNHFYRLKMKDIDGKFSFSPVIKISSKQGKNNWVYPTIIQNNIIRVYPDAGMDAIELYNSQGQLVLKQLLNGNLYKEISVSGFAKGAYIIKLQSGKVAVTQKIIIQ